MLPLKSPGLKGGACEHNGFFGPPRQDRVPLSLLLTVQVPYSVCPSSETSGTESSISLSLKQLLLATFTTVHFSVAIICNKTIQNS